MEDITAELDREIDVWKSSCFAPRTKATYRSQAVAFLKFCSITQTVPVPITQHTLCRYVAYLSRSYAYSSIQQYLNVVRIIHVCCGFPNPLCENFELSIVLKGIKRVKGVAVCHKEPLCPESLMQIRKLLNLQLLMDAQFFAALLTCFFGLLRISNVTCQQRSGSSGTDSSIKREDTTFSIQGTSLAVRRSKTIQCQERVHVVALPLYVGHPLCPTSAVLNFLKLSGPVPTGSPLFSVMSDQKCVALTASTFRRRLSKLLSQLGYPIDKFNTHSLRRGGATWLLTSGVPLATIKAIGDWSSDAVFAYLKPTLSQRFHILTELKPSLHHS